MEVRMVEYARVAPFAALAAKEQATIKPSDRTQWFAALSSRDRVLGVGGVWWNGSIARLKGYYTPHTERAAGVGWAIVVETMLYARSLGPDVIELFMSPNRRRTFWEALGFSEVGVKPNGAVHFRALPWSIDWAKVHRPGIVTV